MPTDTHLFQRWLYAATLADELLHVRWILTGPPPGPGDPPPISPTDLIASQTVVGLLGDALYPNPEGDDPEGHGPRGPVTDVLVGVAIFRLAAQIRNSASSKTMQTAAAELLVRSSQQIKEAVK